MNQFMSKIKISCELPLDMLSDNYNLNDYDLVLFHLYISNESYRRYYQSMRVVHPNRVMILDNSAYEFYIKGETLDLKKYKSIIEELNPTYYILPDKLMDQKETLRIVKEFFEKYSPNTKSKPMGVVQGYTEGEMIECIYTYRTKFPNIDSLCLPFHNSFFKEYPRDSQLQNEFADIYNLDTIDDLTEDMYYAMGRINFIHNNHALLDDFDYVHLLGSHCPFESSFYGDSRINSIDTGYPVKLGIEHKILGSERNKPNIIIDDFLDKKLTSLEKRLIQTNIRIMKES